MTIRKEHVKKHNVPANELLAELYRTARSVPVEFDGLAAWIAKLQGLHTTYVYAAKREERKCDSLRRHV